MLFSNRERISGSHSSCLLLNLFEKLFQLLLLKNLLAETAWWVPAPVNLLSPMSEAFILCQRNWVREVGNSVPNAYHMERKAQESMGPSFLTYTTMLHMWGNKTRTFLRISRWYFGLCSKPQASLLVLRVCSYWATDFCSIADFTKLQACFPGLAGLWFFVFFFCLFFFFTLWTYIIHMSCNLMHNLHTFASFYKWNLEYRPPKVSQS